jgi:hypothetical protein
MKIYYYHLPIILFSLFIFTCNGVHVSSSDEICREMFKAKNEVQSPTQACLDFFVIASLGIPSDSPGYQISVDGSILQCYIYLDKWQGCKEKSPYWIEVMFE